MMASDAENKTLEGQVRHIERQVDTPFRDAVARIISILHEGCTIAPELLSPERAEETVREVAALFPPVGVHLRDRSTEEKAVGNLLAVIHSDGGHYEGEHGTAKAAEDAKAKYYELIRRADRTEYELSRLKDGPHSQLQLLLDELGGICDALGINFDNSSEAANIIGALLNAFGDQKVYWHRKTNTIYCEYARRVTQQQILKDEHLYFSAPRPALVTDDAEEDEELVVYYNPATMGYFARPARLFDDESRFVPLAGRKP